MRYMILAIACLMVTSFVQAEELDTSIFLALHSRPVAAVTHESLDCTVFEGLRSTRMRASPTESMDVALFDVLRAKPTAKSSTSVLLRPPQNPSPPTITAPSLQYVPQTLIYAQPNNCRRTIRGWICK